MTIKKISLLAVGSVFLLFLLLAYIASDRLILSNYIDIEIKSNQEKRTNLEKLLHAELSLPEQPESGLPGE